MYLLVQLTNAGRDLLITFQTIPWDADGTQRTTDRRGAIQGAMNFCQKIPTNYLTIRIYTYLYDIVQLNILSVGQTTVLARGTPYRKTNQFCHGLDERGFSPPWLPARPNPITTSLLLPLSPSASLFSSAPASPPSSDQSSRPPS